LKMEDKKPCFKKKIGQNDRLAVLHFLLSLSSI
jgi:hypothetical protein